MKRLIFLLLIYSTQTFSQSGNGWIKEIGKKYNEVYDTWALSYENSTTSYYVFSPGVAYGLVRSIQPTNYQFRSRRLGELRFYSTRGASYFNQHHELDDTVKMIPYNGVLPFAVAFSMSKEELKSKYLGGETTYDYLVTGTTYKFEDLPGFNDLSVEFNFIGSEFHSMYLIYHEAWNDNASFKYPDLSTYKFQHSVDDINELQKILPRDRLLNAVATGIRHENGFKDVLLIGARKVEDIESPHKAKRFIFCEPDLNFENGIRNWIDNVFARAIYSNQYDHSIWNLGVLGGYRATGINLGPHKDWSSYGVYANTEDFKIITLSETLKGTIIVYYQLNETGETVLEFVAPGSSSSNRNFVTAKYHDQCLPVAPRFVINKEEYIKALDLDYTDKITDYGLNEEVNTMLSAIGKPLDSPLGKRLNSFVGGSYCSQVYVDTDSLFSEIQVIKGFRIGELCLGDPKFGLTNKSTASQVKKAFRGAQFTDSKAEKIVMHKGFDFSFSYQFGEGTLTSITIKPSDDASVSKFRYESENPEIIAYAKERNLDLSDGFALGIRGDAGASQLISCIGRPIGSQLVQNVLKTAIESYRIPREDYYQGYQIYKYGKLKIKCKKDTSFKECHIVKKIEFDREGYEMLDAPTFKSLSRSKFAQLCRITEWSEYDSYMDGEINGINIRLLFDKKKWHTIVIG